MPLISKSIHKRKLLKEPINILSNNPAWPLHPWLWYPITMAMVEDVSS